MRYILILILLSCYELSFAHELKTETLSKEDQEYAKSLWMARCGKCHLPRDPREYNEFKWKMVLLHMSAKANLNKKERDLIHSYFKSLEKKKE